MQPHLATGKDLDLWVILATDGDKTPFLFSMYFKSLIIIVCLLFFFYLATCYTNHNYCNINLCLRSKNFNDLQQNAEHFMPL